MVKKTQSNYGGRMDIQFDKETLSVKVDLETYLRMAQGTEFQQSMNLLAIIKHIMEDADKEILENQDLTPEERAFFQQELVRSHASYLRMNPAPGIDPDALGLFCD